MALTKAQVGLTLDVTETLAVDPAGYANSTKKSVTFDGGDVGQALTPTSTPAANAHAVGQQALSTGAATIDLTSLTGLNGVAVSLSGKSPRAILFENPSANANAITIAKGASNGYAGLGSAFSLTLQPGQKVLVWCKDQGSAVGSGSKTLDLTGTGSQVLNYQIVAG